MHLCYNSYYKSLEIGFLLLIQTSILLPGSHIPRNLKFYVNNFGLDSEEQSTFNSSCKIVREIDNAGR